MRHSRILALALAAGGWTSPPDAIASQLYAYARERKFPAPETLARKGAELAGGDFPFASLAEAPEPQRVFFTAFRAVLEALEPFREEDPAGEVETAAAAPDAPVAGADEFVEIEIVFRQLGGENLVYVQAQTSDGERKQIGFWRPDEDGEHETLLLTVHKSDVRDLPPIGGDFDNSSKGASDASQSAGQVAQAEPVDGTEARDGAQQAAPGGEALDETGPGQADQVADPAADAGGDTAVSDQAEGSAEVDDGAADTTAPAGKNKKKSA